MVRGPLSTEVGTSYCCVTSVTSSRSSFAAVPAVTSKCILRNFPNVQGHSCVVGELMENFIRDALKQPNDYIAYHVGRELAELHPDKAIIEGQTWLFDLDAFVRAGLCSVVEQKSVYHHVRTSWEGIAEVQKQRVENAWLNVLWKGELIDVVLISWAESCYRRRHHWIIADERKIGADFFQAVCDWSCEVRGEILVFHDGYFQKDKQLFDSIKSATFDNLILPESLKRQIE